MPNNGVSYTIVVCHGMGSWLIYSKQKVSQVGDQAEHLKIPDESEKF